MTRDTLISLDLIIPVFNEEEILPQLFDRLAGVFSRTNLDANGVKQVTYYFINDGSQDKTAFLVKEKIEQGIPACLISFSRNFGHQNAVTAGMEYSQGDVVAIIDADLQDPPEVVYDMLKKWRDGFDVVYAQRRKRKEGFFKVFCCWLYYRILNFLSDIDIGIDSGDFCLMDRRVIDALKSLPEKLRFPRGLRAWVGFKQTGIEYERVARAAGESKYPFSKLIALATNGIASLSVQPLKIAQYFAMIFGFLLLMFAVLSIYKYITYAANREMALWLLMAYALIAFIGFLIMIVLYIQSSYIARIYQEVKGRPSFIVIEKIDPKDWCS